MPPTATFHLKENIYRCHPRHHLTASFLALTKTTRFSSITNLLAAALTSVLLRIYVLTNLFLLLRGSKRRRALNDCALIKPI